MTRDYVVLSNDLNDLGIRDHACALCWDDDSEPFSVPVRPGLDLTVPICLPCAEYVMRSEHVLRDIPFFRELYIEHSWGLTVTTRPEQGGLPPGGPSVRQEEAGRGQPAGGGP